MTTPALPDWPALMGLELASAYCGMGETTFRLFALEKRLHPVDTGRRLLLWRRADLDRAVDSLPARGPSSPAMNTDAPVTAAGDAAEAALERAAARAERRARA